MLKNKFLVGALAFAVALGASGSFAAGLGGWRDLMSKTSVTPEQVKHMDIGGIIFDPSWHDMLEFIRLAVEYQSAAVVKAAADRFVTRIPSCFLDELVRKAIEVESIEKVEVLIKAAIDAHHIVNHYVSHDKDMIKLLGYDPFWSIPENGFKRCFFSAACKGSVGAAKIIFDAVGDEAFFMMRDRGELVNCVDSDGFHTPLYYAIENGHYDMVDFLLKHGANVGFKQENGDTVLHRAAYTNHPDILIRLLQEPDARKLVNERNLHGHTPLHNAALAGCWNGIVPLVNAGADVYCRCTCWRVGKSSPLDHAIDKKTAYELVRCGATK